MFLWIRSKVAICLRENEVSIIGNSRLGVIVLEFCIDFFKRTDADGDSVRLIKWSELYALADVFYSVQTMLHHFKLRTCTHVQPLSQFRSSRMFSLTS